ncbi:chromate transporter-domain-containing protein [Hypomontagnella monticulosa]|nr:chromate transporter-domain-containing protein [Hypomontagnella monticulosa]
MSATMPWSHWNFPDVNPQAFEIFKANWHLGLTSFGGPPVHFKILHDRFVIKLRWVDEQVYQELFSVSQAVTGPASTKMLYCINLLHNGLAGALLGFLLWCLPGALGMFALSLGVSQIADTLPRPVYALLSGLNASTVGVVALAAVQLSRKAITDRLTRILVFLGATAGMLYNALWYFPLLIGIAGLMTIVYDFRWLHRPVNAVLGLFERRRAGRVEEDGVGTRTFEEESSIPQSRQSATRGQSSVSRAPAASTEQVYGSERDEPRVIPPERRINISWKFGLSIIAMFFLSFTIIITLRGVLPGKTLLYSLFANLYLAGTIIFGGGPVVIPLLREYIVTGGWVSPRDFLIGLAIIQSFPGPNFNFAVYLGSLTAARGGYSAVAGAIIGFVGIFAPGIIICHGTMGLWGAVRGNRIVKSILRGVNAAAVGLIYTAVYRLWQIGYIDEGFEQGKSLGEDPWWVVITATSYVGGSWFGLPAPLAIILGAIMGLIRCGIIL